jgi:hypothetical protein
MTEFWVASGHHLARRDAAGLLAVTDELLLAWLARPEVAPPPEACAAEQALFARLRGDPRAPVSAGDVAAMSDPDARENWTHLIAFRDLLIAAGTVEGAWLKQVRERRFTPQIFLAHLAQLTLRNALDGCEDPLTLRAAELFFRPQASRVKDGAIQLADLELVEAIERERAHQPLTALLNPDPWGEIDVMSASNAWTWWSRSDAHSMALAWGDEPKAREGFAAAVAAFLRHMLGVATYVEPVLGVETDLRWYVGLDEGGTKLGDALWRGQTPPHGLADRLIGLFRLTFLNPAQAAPGLGGAPVWLILTLGADGRLRMKPQNLLVGLPLAEAA